MQNNENNEKCARCKNFERLYYLTTSGFRPTSRGTCSMWVRKREFDSNEDACNCFRQDPLSEEKRNAIIQAKNTIANFEQTLYRLLKYIDELDKRIDKDN